MQRTSGRLWSAQTSTGASRISIPRITRTTTVSKDIYIEAHEELIAEYLDMDPMVSWSVAYEITAPEVEGRLADKYGAMIDYERMAAKG